MSARHLVIVPHTHWDREWYQTFEQFRARLVPLLDDLLDRLEGDPDFRHFTLDGQTIVVEDYLEIRPQARERIGKLVRDGRLLVGPWYVLPDEWLVSGEALIRNLRLGLRQADALGGAMRVGYVPDQFGHVGQLPQIFAGFGFDAAVLWRGVGADVDQTTFLWEAPDATRLFTSYLVHGYGNAEALPPEPEALAERLARIRSRLERFSRIPTLLLMNGSDHRTPQPGLPAALEAALARLPDVSGEIGTLPGYLARARRESEGALPVHRGELRSGLRAPLLPGCASSRMQQKRRDFRLDSLLTRSIEPLSAWLAVLGAEPDVGRIEHAWRLVLENHPHDSICGCSIDAVHEQIDARLARAGTVVDELLESVATTFAKRVAVPTSGFGAGAGESVVVWNPNAPGVGLVDGVLEAQPPRRGRGGEELHLRDASGRRIPASAEILDAGAERLDLTLPASLRASLLRMLEGDFAGTRVAGARFRRRGRRLEVSLELRRTAPPGAAAQARRALAEQLDRGGVDEVAVRGRRAARLRLRFVDDLPGWGVRVYRLAPGPAGLGPGGLERECRADGSVRISNSFWRICVAADGRLDWEHLPSGTRASDALRFVSEGDRGDEYNFDPVPDGLRVERPERVRVVADPEHEAAVGVTLHAHYRVPRGLARDRRARSRSRVGLLLTLHLRLARGLDRVDLEVTARNAARDHRLRLHLRCPFAATRLAVESAFEVSERPIEPGRDAFGSGTPAELPVGTSPQRGFARLDDARLALCVANRGGGEVEAVRREDGTSELAFTLLRAVGWLSRGDLALRPWHAGPPLATPGAQVPGLHQLAFAVRLHAADEAGCSSESHRFAHPPWVRPGGGAADAPLADGARLVEVDDPAVVISAVEPRAESGPVLRLYNASDQPRAVAVRVPLSARGLEPVDLAERETGSPSPDSHPLPLRPWQIQTLRVR